MSKRGLSGNPSPLQDLMIGPSKPSGMSGQSAQTGRKQPKQRGVERRGRATAIKQREVHEDLDRAVAGVLALGDIKSRIGTPTRELDPAHLVGLAESIRALGLLESLVLDRDAHLLAGGHCHSACELLATPANERTAALLRMVDADKVKDETLQRLVEIEDGTGEFDASEVPIRFIDFRSSDDKERALAIEAAENEQRRDYTASEARALYLRLKNAGYRTTRGRSKKGQKRALPVLAAIMGKSERHVREMVKEGGRTTSKDRNEVYGRKLLKQALQRYLNRHEDDAPKRLRDKANALLKAMD